MGSVDIVFLTRAPFFCLCFAFHVFESTFTHFGSHVIIIIVPLRHDATMK